MKRALMIIGLGIAFVGASLWVVLSGGRSAKAIRAKFRLGGAILTIVSFTSLASCENGGFMVSCYDPAPPSFYVQSADLNYVTATEVRNGDGLCFDYLMYSENYKTLRLVITDMDGNELQAESYELKYGGFSIGLTVDVGEYTGEALLWVYRVDNADNEEQWEEPYKLNIVAKEQE